MVNKEIKVPKKYQSMLDEITIEKIGFTELEYTAFAKEGYFFENTESHMAVGNTKKEILEDIRTLKKCNCKDCNF